ncbi:expressed unknown protein [Seminavis robusta]|uniref:Uncharacterized protein n=1 Tax=Seminavis robusta TaxID=568900 RepID=A0A9N8EHF7_9STRA|nr:expressed unknown protein [Seminavis robusta]|eukprot:Sro1196_g251440.1 n/a (222) ;mRNA; r:3153-3818
MSYTMPSHSYAASDLAEKDPLDSVTTMTADLDDDEWNLDISDLLNDDRVRTPFGRSTSFDQERRIDVLIEGEGSTSGSTTKSRRKAPRRSVSFGKVEVRAFERILASNPPTCTHGVSLGLGWNYIEKKAVDVDKFESKGKIFPWGGSKRSNKELLMSPEKREKTAKKLGFTPSEIQANAKLMDKVNRQRKKTVNAFLEEQYEEMFIKERARQAAQMGVISS